MTDEIKINDVILDISAGDPFTFTGLHSGENLAGINLNFLANEKSITEIEKLFDAETVHVVDPYQNREYKALLKMQTNSYTINRPGRRYTAEIRELDLVPQFQILDIDGNQFDVMKYREDEFEDNVIGRFAVLRLSNEQFMKLLELMNKKTVQIKRLDVDDAPMEVRWGGAMYWSRHEEDNLIYFKQIVRFFPPDVPGSDRLSIATKEQLQAIAIMAIDMSIRFEALLNELSTNNILSDEQRNRLLTSKHQDLLDKSRIDEILLKTDKRADAEDAL